jgi:alpha-amylase
MPHPIRFVLALHNHQPTGNFDHVFEQAFQDSYQPFLEVLARFPSLKISLHASGSLMEWLDARHPEYVDRLAEMVAAGQIEILGGAFFEPILAMLPTRDRIGQIRTYTRWLENRLGASVRGMWVAERVWEQSFVRDLVAAGIEYTVLDDFHFKNAGLGESELFGRYLTEDDGRVMSIYPGSERLRYLIPFGQVHETVDYLRSIAEDHPSAVVVFGDDGEKFGTWPETRKHVYDDGWLTRFFEALAENGDWLETTTLAEAFDHVRPEGKIYLPDSSYREMTEWALPAERQTEYDRLSHEMQQDPRWPALKRFVRGGFWRNFRVKYSESNEMYCRMMSVSGRLQQAVEDGAVGELVDEARQELYRGQCNCGYWHGAFGGVYLPHLRNAVFQHLIAADNLLDRLREDRRPQAWIEAKAEDLNFDGRQEIQLANDKLVALVAPAGGGHLYELDVRPICHNLLATLTRRPEAYHRKVLGGSNQGDDSCASIHDRVVFKQEGLDQRLQYDSYPRKSLVDMFYEPDVTLEAVAGGQATPRGDFLGGDYEARLRRNPDRVQIQLIREGSVLGVPLKITKALTLSAGSSMLEVAYQLEGMPRDARLWFAVELNFAGMPGEADDRYFHDLRENRLGRLETRLDLADVAGLGLSDDWLGVDVALMMSRPTNFWTFPIESVSQSEGGFELVHQSVAVQPHWMVTPDAEGRWAVVMRMEIGTGKAASHAENPAMAVTT